MKYYIHKQTGEPLALLNGSMIDVHTHERHGDYPHLGKTNGVLNLCIFPRRWAANGVPYQAIDYKELSRFKRVSKKKFAEICPDFGQWRHKDDITFSGPNPLNIPIRKATFGN